jgi:hypothetical protein
MFRHLIYNYLYIKNIGILNLQGCKDVGKYLSQNCFCCCHKQISEFKNEEEYEDYEENNDISG